MLSLLLAPIIRGFHAQEAEIEIEHYDPIINISERFIEDDMMCIGIRQMIIPGKGYYMESGETYTLLIHSPTDDYFVYYKNAQEDELANEMAYENVYYSLNTGFYVTNEFEKCGGVRKFCGILSVDVERS